MLNNIIAIDSGGTSLKLALINDNKIIERTVFYTTELDNPGMLVYKSKGWIESLNKPIDGIGFSWNSVVRKDKKVKWGVRKGFNDPIDILKMFKDASVPGSNRMTILNDGKSALMAELNNGPAKDCENVSMVTVGTALAGAAVCDGHMINGPLGVAGELSQVFTGFKSIDGDSPAEQEFLYKRVSFFSLIQNYKKLTSKELTGKEIFDLSKREDVNAQNVVTIFMDNLSILVHNLFVYYGSEIVIIGGGATGIEGLLDYINSRLAKLYKNNDWPMQAKLIKAEAGADAGLMGAYEFFNRRNNG